MCDFFVGSKRFCLQGLTIFRGLHDTVLVAYVTGSIFNELKVKSSSNKFSKVFLAWLSDWDGYQKYSQTTSSNSQAFQVWQTLFHNKNSP